jgi:hypothetical protein
MRSRWIERLGLTAFLSQSERSASHRDQALRSNPERLARNDNMPPYTIPRRPFSPRTSDPVPINWRRGLFRVWLLISAAWMMSWIIYFILYGLQGGFTRLTDVFVILVLLFGPPVALAIFGIATRWAFQGFKVDEPPAQT